MTWQVWAIGVLAVAVLLLAAYAVALRRRVRGTAPEPVGPAEPQPVLARAAPPVATDEEGFVITRVGQDGDVEAVEDAWRVSDRLVLSATLGEPLVRTVAFVHGVRRALSPANRNRIRFEVRQEVRRTRKVRRQEMRVAWRQMKAQERTQERTQERDDVEGAA